MLAQLEKQFLQADLAQTRMRVYFRRLSQLQHELQFFMRHTCG